MWVVYPVITFLFLHQASALECYVCNLQENNKDKCVETVATCDIGEDRCLTEVKWGSTPYWAPSGEKQYYISKRCASKSVCTMQTAAVTNRCDRIWFNDWECVECCHGDRCNFYVTLSAHTALPSTSSIIIALLISTILPYLYAVQK